MERGNEEVERNKARRKKSGLSERETLGAITTDFADLLQSYLDDRYSYCIFLLYCSLRSIKREAVQMAGLVSGNRLKSRLARLAIFAWPTTHPPDPCISVTPNCN